MHFSTILPLLALSAASPIANRNSWPPAGSPSYTGCSFVEQIGAVNVFACNVLNGNTISIPISVSVPISIAKREAEPTNWPPAGTPSYKGCSFVQQIGVINAFLCDVLNDNTISIPIAVSIPVSIAKRDAEPNSWPPAGTPSYTGCSFVEQIGLVNAFLCDVLNGNTISVPIAVSIPISAAKRDVNLATRTSWPPASSPSYTGCSYVEQIGLLNIFACDVLNGNTISIPISVSVPVSVA